MRPPTTSNRSINGADKRNLLIVFLLLVCAALVSTIVYIDLQLRTERLANILFPADDADRIDINNQGKMIFLRKQQDQWQLTRSTDPAVTDSGAIGSDEIELADSQRIAVLLALLRMPDTGRYKLSDVNPEAIGLTDAAITLKINDIEFMLGGEAIGNRRYVQVMDTVFLAPDIAYPLINAGPNAFKIAEVRSNPSPDNLPPEP